MEKFQYYLFDWDGCLADSLSLWMGVYQEVYRSYGVAASVEEIVAKSWGNLELGPLNFGIQNNRKVWDEIVQKVTEKMKTVSLFPGAREILQKLHEQGKKIAVVTASNLTIVAPPIKFHELQPYIDFLITEHDVTKPKPDPEMVILALKNLSPEEFARKTEAIKAKAVIIGDTDKDILAGKAAGIKSVLVLHQPNNRFYDFAVLKKSRPDFVINSFTQLLPGIPGQK